MPRIIPTILTCGGALMLVIGLATPASADITGFIGLSTTPAKHTGGGFAFGMGLVVVGFELEYSSLSENSTNAVPGLKTGTGNLMLQTPTKGFQFYGTTGGGVFHETFRGASTTGFGSNIGGGVKISLAGPLRLRLDYRVYHLQGSPLYQNPKRFYMGVNVSF